MGHTIKNDEKYNDLGKQVMGNKVVCILGMHRSGTSMITRIANILGVYLGESQGLMGAADSNPEGHWEHGKINSIHEEMLKVLNRTWDSIDPLPSDWLQNPIIQYYKKNLISVIEEEFKDKPLWGFKDPRTCVFLPLWREIFYELELEPHYIMPLRNPLDIAASLVKRDEMNEQKTLSLWYYYALCIVENTKDASRLIVDYNTAIEKPIESAKRIADYLNMSFSDEFKPRILTFVKPELRHSAKMMDDLFNLDPEIARLFSMLQDGDWAAIQNTSHNYDNYAFFRKRLRADFFTELNMKPVLFIDFGKGFSDKHIIIGNCRYEYDKSVFSVYYDIGRFKEKNNIASTVKNIRWDPIEGRNCLCEILGVETDGVYGGVKYKNSLNTVNGKDVFLTTDPIYEFDGNFKKANFLKISYLLDFDCHSFAHGMQTHISLADHKIEQLIFSERELKAELQNKEEHIEQLILSERELKAELQNKEGHIKQLILSERELKAELQRKEEHIEQLILLERELISELQRKE